MSSMLGSNLAGAVVMTNDGLELGELSAITMNPRTGALRELVVEPREEPVHTDRYEVDGSGQYRIPAGNVQGFEDYITVAAADPHIQS